MTMLQEVCQATRALLPAVDILYLEIFDPATEFLKLENLDKMGITVENAHTPLTIPPFPLPGEDWIECVAYESWLDVKAKKPWSFCYGVDTNTSPGVIHSYPLDYQGNYPNARQHTWFPLEETITMYPEEGQVLAKRVLEEGKFPGFRYNDSLTRISVDVQRRFDFPMMPIGLIRMKSLVLTTGLKSSPEEAKSYALAIQDFIRCLHPGNILSRVMFGCKLTGIKYKVYLGFWVDDILGESS